jgi:protein-tyrosine phosphatase
LAKRILLVCLGNICRSPLADGLLLRKIKEQNLDLTVDSAGTANYHVGKAPDHRMIQTAAKHGTSLGFLRARQFTSKDFQNFDHILVMDQSNYNDVTKLAQHEAERQKVEFFLDYLYPNQKAAVPDPYYGSLKDFEEVYNLVDKATDALIQKLIDEH